MKFNLGNRPKWDNRLSIKANIENVEIFFKDFERELREILDSSLKNPKWQLSNIELVDSGKRLMIKEILGDQK